MWEELTTPLAGVMDGLLGFYEGSLQVMNRCGTLICIHSHCNKITYESLVRAWNGGELLILWVKHLLSSLQAVCILNCSANVIKCFIRH